jgi:hypothetical protein
VPVEGGCAGVTVIESGETGGVPELFVLGCAVLDVAGFAFCCVPDCVVVGAGVVIGVGVGAGHGVCAYADATRTKTQQ